MAPAGIEGSSEALQTVGKKVKKNHFRTKLLEKSCFFTFCRALDLHRPPLLRPHRSRPLVRELEPPPVPVRAVRLPRQEHEPPGQAVQVGVLQEAPGPVPAADQGGVGVRQVGAAVAGGVVHGPGIGQSSGISILWVRIFLLFYSTNWTAI